MPTNLVSSSACGTLKHIVRGSETFLNLNLDGLFHMRLMRYVRLSLARLSILSLFILEGPTEAALVDSPRNQKLNSHQLCVRWEKIGRRGWALAADTASGITIGLSDTWREEIPTTPSFGEVPFHQARTCNGSERLWGLEADIRTLLASRHGSIQLPSRQLLQSAIIGRAPALH